MPRVRGIKELIDRGAVLDKKMKVMAAELNPIKKKVKGHASATDQHHLKGVIAEAFVDDTTESVIDLEELFDLIMEHPDDFDFFKSVVRANVTGIRKFAEANDYFPLSQVVTMKNKPFSRVTFS